MRPRSRRGHGRSTRRWPKPRRIRWSARCCSASRPCASTISRSATAGSASPRRRPGPRRARLRGVSRPAAARARSARQPPAEWASYAALTRQTFLPEASVKRDAPKRDALTSAALGRPALRPRCRPRRRDLCLEERRHVAQRDLQRLQPRRVEMDLVVGGVAEVLHDAAAGRREARVDPLDDVVEVVAAAGRGSPGMPWSAAMAIANCPAPAFRSMIWRGRAIWRSSSASASLISAEAGP